MNANTLESQVEKRFLQELTHHLAGWRAKITNDFSKSNYDKELNALKSDPLYPKFNFATPDYVNIRFMGRVSISIGRRLGEIYDKIPRFVAGARFNLKPEEVAPVIGGLELDICLATNALKSNDDKTHVTNVTKAAINDFDPSKHSGLGIEIRYNFNPNDSSRLRKDEDMASKLIEKKLFPIYLIFSSISPRDEAISRLERAGWKFLIGDKAINFSTQLLGVDLGNILDRPAVNSAIKKEVDAMMYDLKMSHSFAQFVNATHERKK
jgi:hypothetical protein